MISQNQNAINVINVIKKISQSKWKELYKSTRYSFFSWSLLFKMWIRMLSLQQKAGVDTVRVLKKRLYIYYSRASQEDWPHHNWDNLVKITYLVLLVLSLLLLWMQKPKEIENKITDITKLATKAALNTTTIKIESNTPDITNLTNRAATNTKATNMLAVLILTY